MKSIGKHIERVVIKSRLSRFFVGTFANAVSEHWYEMGHFSQGVDIKLERIKELNGRKQFTGSQLGWIVSGTYEPGQNEIEDYEFYERLMNGVRDVAILTGTQLWIFRVRAIGPKLAEDNRISLYTYPAYGDTRRKGAGEVGGFIRNYEMIRTEKFEFIEASGKFKYVAKATHRPRTDNPTAPIGLGVGP